MAGTKEGIAKANAAKARRRAERAAALAAFEAAQKGGPASAAVTLSDAGLVVQDRPGAGDAIRDAMSLPMLDAISLGAVPPVVGGSNEGTAAVSLTRQALNAMLLPSLGVLNRIIQGQIKAPAIVRANSAIRVLEMAGVPVDAKPAPGADLSAGVSRLFDAFSRLAQLRQRAAGAETVTPIDQAPPAPSQK